MGFGLGLEVGAEEEEELVQLPSLRPPSCFQHQPPRISLPRPPPLARPHQKLLPFCLKQRELEGGEGTPRQLPSAFNCWAAREAGLCSQAMDAADFKNGPRLASRCRQGRAGVGQSTAIRDDLLQNNPRNINRFLPVLLFTFIPMGVIYL